MERQKIAASNSEDRTTIATILIKNGYTVRFGREKQGNKVVCFVEYWRESDAVPC